MATSAATKRAAQNLAEAYGELENSDAHEMMVIPGGPDDPGPAAGFDEEPDEFAELNKVITELSGSDGAEGNVRVERIRPGETKAAFCKTYPAADFNLDRISDEFGGGKYRVSLYGPNPNNANRWSILYKRTYDIVEPIKRIIPDAEKPRPLTAEDVERLLNARQPQPGIAVAQDPMTMMQSMMTMMVTMKEFMGGGQKSSLVETLEGIKLMREVASDIAPGGEPESEVGRMIGLAKDFLPMLQQAGQNQQPQIQHAPVPQIATRIEPRRTPVQNPHPVTATPPASNTPPKNGDTDMLSLMLAAMANKAARDADPGLSAEFLMEDISDAELPQFLELLESPAWFETLCAFNPAIRPFQEWFAELREACIQAIKETPQETGEPVPVEKTEDATPPPSGESKTLYPAEKP